MIVFRFKLLWINLNDQLIKSQLKELKSLFKKEINLNDKIKIFSDTLNISKIKEIMIRLLDVSNQSIKEYKYVHLLITY